MEKLCLGVAQEIITPEIGGNLYGYTPDVYSTCVNDDLTITAYYFKQGKTQALMLGATVCATATAYAAELLTLIEEKYGIPSGNIQLTSTHTHSGPNLSGGAGWGDRDVKYCNEVFTPAVLKVTAEAMKNPQAVTMGYAVGESNAAINRRQLNNDNAIILGQNPFGPIDLTMTVLSFKNDADETVANIIHYGCHGTCAGKNTEITRDWSGVMVDAIAHRTKAPTAFFGGPEGDIGPRLSNGKTIGDLRYVYEAGSIAAADAMRIYNSIKEYKTPKLAVFGGRVDIPFKPRMPRAEAEELYEKYKDHVVSTGAMLKRRAEEIMEAWDKGIPEEESYKMPQTVIRLGDCVFASSTFELFTEIGIRIRGFFKDLKVMCLVNTNGSDAYFATESELPRGGYEITLFKYRKLQSYCDNADFEYIKATANNVQKVLED